MILAGGTGGHVFPALAVARRLRDRGVPVVWMGTRQGLESRVVPGADIPMEWLTVRGLRGKGLRGWLTAPLMVIRAVAGALSILRRHRPRAVLGMGGYVAGPGALAARLTGVPLVIHEQNAVAGMTNRWLARLATRVLTGFRMTFPGAPAAVFVGNPVRPEIAELPAPETRCAGREGRARLLVFGGSLGARALNELVPAAIGSLAAGSRPEIRHQAGSRTLETARRAYAQAGVEASVEAFIEDMAAAYAWADLVVCRAGALTVAEIAAAGLPAVFIPFPHAVDDHQTANARFLADGGAALILQERELSSQRLRETLEALLGDRERLLSMSLAARRLGRPEAADAVADVCLEVAT